MITVGKITGKSCYVPEECEFWRAGGIRLTGEVWTTLKGENQPYRREAFFQMLFFLQLKVVLENRTAGEWKAASIEMNCSNLEAFCCDEHQHDLHAGAPEKRQAANWVSFPVTQFTATSWPRLYNVWSLGGLMSWNPCFSTNGTCPGTFLYLS